MHTIETLVKAFPYHMWCIYTDEMLPEQGHRPQVSPASRGVCADDFLIRFTPQEFMRIAREYVEGMELWQNLDARIGIMQAIQYVARKYRK